MCCGCNCHCKHTVRRFDWIDERFRLRWGHDDLGDSVRVFAIDSEGQVVAARRNATPPNTAARYAAAGDVTYLSGAGGFYVDNHNRITADGSGNVYVGWDRFVAKIDSTGAVVWSIDLLDPPYSEVSTILVRCLHFPAFTGELYLSAGLPGSGNNSGGVYTLDPSDAAILAVEAGAPYIIESRGDYIFSHRFHGNHQIVMDADLSYGSQVWRYDYDRPPNALAPDSTNGCIVSAGFFSSEPQLFRIHTPTGSAVLDWELAGPAHDVAIDADDNIYALRWNGNNVDTDSPRLSRITLDGEVIRERMLHAAGYRVRVDAEGSIYVAGNRGF